MDIQSRYYKKINHKNITFTAEEDQVILNMYNKIPLTNFERKIIKVKGSFAVKKRLEILLKLKGEELDKSFNISSCLSSSISSIHNNSNLMKLDEMFDYQISKTKENSCQISKKIKINNYRKSSKVISSKTLPISECINSETPNITNKKLIEKEIKIIENKKETQSMHSYLPCMDAEFNADISNSVISFYENTSKTDINRNTSNLIFEKDRTMELKEEKDKFNINNISNDEAILPIHQNFDTSPNLCYKQPMMSNTNANFNNNDFSLELPKESIESFEHSFYDAFNSNGKNDFFIDVNENLDFDEVLNKYSNSNISELVEKNKSLEQILNQVH